MEQPPALTTVCTACGALGGRPHLPACPTVPEDLPQSEPGPPGHVRPSWDDYYFTIAQAVSARATCPRAHIGCLIVDPNTHMILATGYNGALTGQPHCDDVGCDILADHCVRAVHAEVNAAAQVSLFIASEMFPDDEPLVAYVYGPRPVCSHCARELYEQGVREVRWRAS